MEKSVKSQSVQPLAENMTTSDKQKRSFGLKAFDAILYPGIANIGVFSTSVFFTYLTNRGSKFGKAGSSARWIGENVFEKRGEWMKNNFMKAGLSHNSANNAKMVFWSFVDGSLLAPAIKWFEDDREKIARKIDNAFGTTPEDDSVYTAEPKQTWTSILGGRALTAGVVVMTAAALDKQTAEGFSWNRKLFYNPGIKAGNWVVNKHPSITKIISKEAFQEVSRVTIFEAVYTSICTAGLYVSSRFIASHLGHNNNQDRSPTGQRVDEYRKQKDDPIRLSNLMHPEEKDTPDTKVEKTQSQDKLSKHEAQIA